MHTPPDTTPDPAADVTTGPPMTPAARDRRRRRPRSFARAGVVLASIAIALVGIVVAALCFLDLMILIPNAALAYIATIALGVGIAFGLSYLALSRTSRRRDSRSPWVRRTFVSTLTAASAAAVLIAGATALALPALADGSARPAASDGTQFADLPTGSRLAWWKTEATTETEKAPVIFLHGGPGSFVGGTQPFFDRLADQGRDVYYYDQVGAGNSSLLPVDEYGMSRLIEDLEAFRETVVQSGTVVVLGHSFGGFLAEAYATAHPQHVEKVALVAPGGGELPDGMTAEEAAEQSVEPREGDIPTASPLPPVTTVKLAATLALLERDPAAAERFMPQEENLRIMAAALGSAGGLNSFANHAVRADEGEAAPEVMDAVEKTALPTLVVRPEYDYISWPSLASYRDRNPRATLVFVANRGHADIDDDTDTAMYEPVRAFIAGEELADVYEGEKDPHFTR